MLSFDETNEKIWQLGAGFFLPGSAKLVTRQQVDQLIGGGIEVISCGVNVSFEDDGGVFGPGRVAQATIQWFSRKRWRKRKTLWSHLFD
jgi:hypothetical protein